MVVPAVTPVPDRVAPTCIVPVEVLLMVSVVPEMLQFPVKTTGCAIVIVGGDVYPLPPFVMVIVLTVPVFSTAVALAPDPTPEIVMVGGER